MFFCNKHISNLDWQKDGSNLTKKSRMLKALVNWQKKKERIHGKNVDDAVKKKGISERQYETILKSLVHTNCHNRKFVDDITLNCMSRSTEAAIDGALQLVLKSWSKKLDRTVKKAKDVVSEDIQLNCDWIEIFDMLYRA